MNKCKWCGAEQTCTGEIIGWECGSCGQVDGELWQSYECQIRIKDAEIERLRSMHVHCDLCGGSWLDDGLSSSCYCQAIKRMREELICANAQLSAAGLDTSRAAAAVKEE
jgi:DNA-directed RNA polymerase subunit N (RpoN/RPB10)